MRSALLCCLALLPALPVAARERRIDDLLGTTGSRREITIQVPEVAAQPSDPLIEPARELADPWQARSRPTELSGAAAELAARRLRHREPVTPEPIELGGERVYFRKNRKRIASRFRPALERLAERLSRPGSYESLRIEGGASASGPRRWNQELSHRRAEQVVAFLIAHGVDASRVREGATAQPVRATAGQDSARQARVFVLRPALSATR